MIPCSDETFLAFLAEAYDGDHIQLYNDADRIYITSEGPLYINVAALLQGGKPSSGNIVDNGANATSATARFAAAIARNVQLPSGRRLLQDVGLPEGLTIIDCQGFPTALVVTAGGAIIR